MKALVDKAPTSAPPTTGMTPMHYAVQRGVDRIIEYPWARTRGSTWGRSPADLARGRTATLVKQLSQQ
jgi:hypothetical protein